MSLLRPEQVRQIATAVTGTDNEPMDALRSFNKRLRILIEENPHASQANLREEVEDAVRVIVTRAKKLERAKAEVRIPASGSCVRSTEGSITPSRIAQGGPPGHPWTPFRQDAAGSRIRG